MWLIPVCAVLNRFRGGGFWADRLPGHPRFYVAPLMGLVAWLAGHDPLWSTLFAAAWLAWCWLPWGQLMCLDRFVPDRKISPIETELLKVASGNIWLALGLRHALGLVPMTILAPGALLMPPLIVAFYEASWRWSPRQHVIAVPELLTGAAFGVLLWLSPSG